MSHLALPPPFHTAGPPFPPGTLHQFPQQANTGAFHGNAGPRLVTPGNVSPKAAPRKKGFTKSRSGSRHRLTEESKRILETWLYDHWQDPYPAEDEKKMLARSCEITLTQVNNWFMNARGRKVRKAKKIGISPTRRG
ncbi:unnamed protein product [Chrysoparadoxa australica]